MKEHEALPSIDHLSVVTAVILLAYALTAFINFPTQSIDIQLPGFLLTFEINFMTIISVVVGLLAAAGADWLINAHPGLGGGRRFHHWLIPAFTALVISVPLNNLQISGSWWAVLSLGGLLLTAVLIAEYISVDPGDLRFPIARVSLSAMSYALLLVLLIAVRGSGLRLYIVLLAILPAVAVVTAKTLHLRLGGWNLAWTAGISLFVTQLATGLFYLPLRPLQFGLVLIGVTYALINLAGGIEEKRPGNLVWIEPTLLIVIFFALAIFI
ncbi:MAG: hypothetical protein CVU42_09790 [Chloroflexi bacterium HGW-Chloroflexi-4]|nr:MAG: hypothetical protein CVU42_09790 [Chloroflexi bacterium HGW-Chloroflexi-4]